MVVRAYQSADCAQLARLFYETVHSVNASDYTPAQLDAWATGQVDQAAWDRSFLEHHTLVAQMGEDIVGFGDMDCHGYLDRLYVHWAHQGQGIGRALVTGLERWAADQGIATFTTHASITAKPFFERVGYRVLQKNTVLRGNVELLNFFMEKPYIL